MQESFDSRGIAQPEIAEKTRACEGYGAEVIRLSVGPELFYVFLCVLKETGYFNSSLYTPYSILGIETAFASGARWLARTTGLPLLPVVITGTHRIWEYPFSQTVRYDQSVTLHVLDPVPPEHLSRPTMRQLEREMKAVALAAPNPVRRFVPARDGWWDGYRFAIDPDFVELHAAFTARRSISGHSNGG